MPQRDAYEAMWSALFGELRESGALAPDVPVGRARLTLFGAMNSAVEWFDVRRGELDPFAETITRQFWSGLAAPRATALAGAGHGDVDAVRSPFPAVVSDLPVAAGDRVEAGDGVAVIEAMEMLHSLAARGAAVVAALHVAVGDSVDGNQPLVSFEAGAGGEGADPEDPEGQR